MDTNGFRQWLERQGSLSTRAVTDVVSRLNRLGRFVDLSKVHERSDMDVALIKSADFQAISRTIKSQLRRAGQLWLDYRKSIK